MFLIVSSATLKTNSALVVCVHTHPRQDYAAAKGSDDYNHLQEQFITTFSSWTEICNSFEVSFFFLMMMMRRCDDVMLTGCLHTSLNLQILAT